MVDVGEILFMTKFFLQAMSFSHVRFQLISTANICEALGTRDVHVNVAPLHMLFHVLLVGRAIVTIFTTPTF